MTVWITAAPDADRTALRENEVGFSLIELLVVVIIIGILAAIAIPVYVLIQNNAKVSAVKSDVSTAKTAVVAYATDNKGALPDTLTAADLPAKYGYPIPAAGNYAVAGRPALSVAGSGSAFCISAVSVTSTQVTASDVSGVVSGATAGCSSGAITP